MRRTLLLSMIIGALMTAPAKAVTCEDGLSAIDNMSKIMELSDFEQANIQALMVKAKLESDRGRQRTCKLILADAIRFFLIKSVIR